MMMNHWWRAFQVDLFITTAPATKCPEKWAREEELDRQFGEALAAIAIDDKAFTWSVKSPRTRAQTAVT